MGRHDFLYTPCSAETFALLYGETGHHPSCLENLARNLAAYGVTPDDIPTTFNIFMNVEIGADGRLTILPPRSRAGDYIELRAEMDLVVGLTACSAEMSNNYRLKPIDYEIQQVAHDLRSGRGHSPYPVIAPVPPHRTTVLVDHDSGLQLRPVSAHDVASVLAADTG